MCRCFVFALGTLVMLTFGEIFASDGSPVRFEKRVLTDLYFCDGINTGDFNRDGRADVVAGPFWYEGPEFERRHEFYPAVALETDKTPSNSMYSYVHDFNGDGWDDILVLGRVKFHSAYWYENPQEQPGLWKKHFVFERIRGESPPFADLNGDGKPELVCHWENRWGWVQPDWSKPTEPWKFHAITPPGDYNEYYHGTGVGDVNGDGRLDLILNEGWWEQPSIESGRETWMFHAYRFGQRGGAQMFADDVDGDGDSDIITSLDAHGWGLAWFEQIQEDGKPTFRRHMIMGDRSEEEQYGVAFSQPHALDLADIDGDGLKDIVTGKRRWAHGPTGDVEPNAAPVVYWFQLRREADGVRYVPHLIDDQSGTGVQVVAADVNADQRTDVLTVSKLGSFVFMNEQRAESGEPRANAKLAKPRLIVLTDIGGDPDDRQSMIRLMLYANEFEIEGLIATAAGMPGELKQSVVRPELIREIVRAYGQVRENLSRHAPGYPPVEQLLDRIQSGNPRRGVENLGDGKDTEGSNWIISVVDRPDPRPVNIVIWGGSTELAQALWRVRNERTPEQLKAFIGKLRVHAINHQDNTGPWILENFPELFYVLSMQPEGRDKRESAYRGMYLGGDESLTSREWIDTHVRNDHGPLGALYPNATWTAPNPHVTLKEGDTPSWFYFLPNGLNAPEHPEWGGWGGRFEHLSGGVYRDAADTVAGQTHARATVWRWRPAFQNDFQARMDWCVRSSDDVNHNPLAAFGSDRSRDIMRITARSGETVALDATASSDPDGDELTFQWWTYPEAGTYRGTVAVAEPNAPKSNVTIPMDAGGKTLQVILQVTDRGEPPLTAYRRIVIDVQR